MRKIQFNIPDARRQRGVAMPVVAAAVVIVILIALAAWLLIFRSADNVGLGPVPEPTAATSEAAPAPLPPADVGSMSVSELLDEARTAMREQRLLAPAGNNAFEFYLEVLEKDPANQVAQDALRETFPFAASAAEQEINAGNFAEAQRQIDVLARADSGNYTLTILRSKLDAQRTLAARAEEQKKLAAEQAAAEAAAAAAAALAAQNAEPEPAQSTPPAEAAVAVEPQLPAPVQEAVPEPEPPPPPPEPVGETRAPILVQTVPAYYPPEAARRRLEGSVVVEFNVDVVGNVINAHVVQATRGNIFNEAAVSAVEQYVFEPALRNGEPVTSATMNQPVVFALN